MKNILSTAFLLVMASVFTVSCDKNKDVSPSNITNTVQQGSWSVTLFNDSGNDETYHFAGYSFNFSNGAVTATKSGSTVSGTYSSRVDDGQNKLVLDFGSAVPFDELNDDWHILEESSSKIRLEDVSGGGGGTDLLTFEKI